MFSQFSGLYFIVLFNEITIEDNPEVYLSNEMD